MQFPPQPVRTKFRSVTFLSYKKTHFDPKMAENPLKTAMAQAMLSRLMNQSTPMNKAHRCLLHARCMMVKSLQGRSVGWHWQHLLREFGRGEYSARNLRQKGWEIENALP